MNNYKKLLLASTIILSASTPVAYSASELDKTVPTKQEEIQSSINVINSRALNLSFNKDGSITLNGTIEGTNLNQVENISFFNKDGMYKELNKNQFNINKDGEVINYKLNISSNEIKNQVGKDSIELKYKLNRGLGNETDFNYLTSDVTITDSMNNLDVNLKTNKANKLALDVNAKAASVTDIDSSSSSIDSSTGDFNLDIKVKGTNLDSIDHVRVYQLEGNLGVYSTIGSDYFTQQTPTLIEVKSVIKKDWYEKVSAGKTQELKISLMSGGTESDLMPITVSTDNSDSLEKDGTISVLGVTSEDVQTAQVKSAAVSVDSVDSSASTVDSNGNFNIDFKIYGDNLNYAKNVRVYLRSETNGSYSTISAASFQPDSNDTMIHVKKEIDKSFYSSSSYIGKENELRYEVDAGLSSSTGIKPIETPIDNSDEVEADGLVSTLGVGADNAQTVKVSSSEYEVKSIDAVDTEIDSDGNFNVDLVVEGTNMDEVNSLRLYASNITGSYSTIPAANFESDSNDSKIHVNTTFNKSLYTKENNIGKDNLLQFELNPGVADSSGKLNAKVSSDNSQTVTTDSYVSSILTNGSFDEYVKVEEVDKTPVIDSVDSKNTVLDKDANVALDVVIKGSNLDAVNNVRLYASDQTGSFSTLPRSSFETDSTDEMLHVKINFNKGLYTKPGNFGKLNQIQYQLNAGQSTATEIENVETSIDNSDTKASDGIVTDLIATDNLQKVEVNPTKDLEVSEQLIIPTYEVGDTVSANKLLTDSSIVYTGDMPITVSGTVDTSSAGDSKLATITFTETTGDLETTTKQVAYNVSNSNVDLEVSDQLTAPTYTKGEAVTAAKLAEDAGITYTGDMPITVSGAVDTSTVGNAKLVKLTFTETSGDLETTSRQVAYNVEEANVDLEVSDQVIAPTYTKGEAVTATKLAEDAGITYTGDMPITVSGAVDTSTVGNAKLVKLTFTETSGDLETTSRQVAYNVEEANVDLEVSDQLTAPTYTKGEAVTATKLAEDAGITYTGDMPITVSGAVDTSTVGNSKLVKLTFTETSGDLETTSKQVTYNVMEAAPVGNLEISEQTTIPTYTVGEEVTTEQLTKDAGVVVKGDGPFVYYETVDTSTVGEKSVTFFIQETAGDHEIKQTTINYVVENSAPTISEGTIVPTYYVDDSVTAEQLFKDSGSTVTGTSPFTYSGAVDTSVEGRDIETTITVTDANGISSSVTLKYNVTDASKNDIVDVVPGVYASTGYANVEYMYNRGLDNARIEAYNGAAYLSTFEITEITGDETATNKFVGLPLGSTITFKLFDGDILIDEETVTIPTRFVASEYFEGYANDADIREFDSNNEIILTDKTWDNDKSRGAYSKYQIDTSQPFTFEGEYHCDSLTFPTGSGKAISFYKSKDGKRNHGGGTSETLGLLENGGPFASEGIAVALDSHNKDDEGYFAAGNQEVEIIDMSQGSGDDDKGNPVEVYYENNGIDNKAIFWTEGWRTLNISWTPYEDTTEYSGNINVEVGIKYDDRSGTIGFDYSVPTTMFPQGYYWMKFSATTPKASEFISPSEMGFKIDNFDAAWVNPESGLATDPADDPITVEEKEVEFVQTSEAEVATSEAEVTTSEAEATTSEAEATTSEAEATTSEAEATTSEAEVATSEAEVATSETEATKEN